MKFKRVKVPSLLGGNEFRYTEDLPSSNTENQFTIIADKSGIRFKGDSGYCYDMSDLQALAEVISSAWTAHNQLKPKLATPSKSLSEH